ncbi:MAG: Cof-type HAD-IIB family hydrolase, partial [Propionibacteriaceae bacterium]|nr:Cof-type HAD-IIB family hydrolase [Propionibacteriaceae bacterium]
MPRPKLIATDLDGTLLDDSSAVSGLNARAMALAASLGVPFVIATGRPVRWLPGRDVLPDAYRLAIVSNGAALCDIETKALSHARHIPPVTALEVAERLHRAIPGVAIGAENGHDFGTEPHTPSAEFADWGGWSGDLEQIVADIDPIIKMFGFHAELDADQLLERAEAALGDDVAITHASMGQRYGVVEILPRGVSKARALE